MRICSIYEIRTDKGNVRYSQKNLYQCHFVQYKHHAGLRGENQTTNSLSYGTNHYRIKKGKSIPLQAWTGPEGSRRFRFSHFKIIGT
jgi:hypothetical protein